MKNIKYLLFSAFAAVALVSCTKHSLSFAPEVDASNMAQFQITYVEPIAVNANNAIDSVFVNGKLVAGATGVGQLAVNGTYPYGPSTGTGKFFATAPGITNIKFYRKGNEVYNQDIELVKGKQEVFVYKLTEKPIILDNLYPYKGNPDRATTATFDTDSIARIRFYNFAFKGDANTPYPGKIQYQWCHDKSKGATARGGADGNWHDIGGPVGFGEASVFEPIQIWKETFNSSGQEQLWFRGIDEAGNVVIANDYWTTLIGVSVKHIYRGVKGGSPSAGITLSGSLR
jgi:hypothetical protein